MMPSVQGLPAQWKKCIHMFDNSYHFRLVRECLFKPRMVLTLISGIVQEWFWKTLGMTSIVSMLMAAGVSQTSAWTSNKYGASNYYVTFAKVYSTTISVIAAIANKVM